MTIDHISAKSRGHWPWFAGILVLADAAAAGIWHRAAPDTGSARSPPPVIPVTVAQARTQDVPIYLSAPGTVQAWNTIAVRSQIDGKLTAVNFVEGQDVQAGDTLAQIDPSALLLILHQADHRHLDGCHCFPAPGRPATAATTSPGNSQSHRRKLWYASIEDAED